MSCTICVAGKGGTGKTTIAGLIIRFLRDKRLGSVLSIDADPNSNLGDVLGVKPKENIGAIIDEISKNIDRIPAGMTKDRYIEYRVQSAIEESDGLDLLAMGRPEGPGCYCFANNQLRNIIGKISKDYKFVIIDNEAGLEHLSRRTMRSADCLFIISDATPIGINSAKRIYELIAELALEVKKTVFIVNRIHADKEKASAGKKLKEFTTESLKFVPYDKNIYDFAVSQRSVMELDKETGAIKAVYKIMEEACR